MTEEFSFEWEERGNNISFANHMISGSIAGLSEHLAFLPIDNLKTHLQSTDNSLKQSFNLIRKSGFRKFFSGSQVITLACIPSHAFFFTNYEIMKRYLHKENEYQIFANFLLGGMSTMFHDLIMTPAEMIKQRLQIMKNVNARTLIKSVYQQEGLFSFWRSLPVNLINNIPSQMVIVSANENLKKAV
jgi:hypothetical protein